MYLSNNELIKIYESVIYISEGVKKPFDRHKQIKVCSIDLRVGNVFWKSRRSKHPINLSSTNLHELSPRRIWKRISVPDDGHIDLKPGEMLLGSTHEKITMPNHLVGKINTRSSYARLGISTACNCDLVNPGYTGHVPLEITNATKNTYQINPYMPLCQLFLMKVDGEIDSYDNKKYKSKYMNDDGGPSMWWRDELVQKVSDDVFGSKLSNDILDELREKFETIDDEGIYRFDNFINEKQYSNASDLLHEFAASEKKKSNIYKPVRAISRWLSPALFIPFIYQIQNKFIPENQSPDIISYIIVTSFILSIFPFLYFWIKEETKYYFDIHK